MIQGKSVQRCNGLGGNRTHYGRPLAAPGRKESVREDKFIKGERVDKCKEGERGGLRIDHGGRVQVPHRSRADLRVDQAK